MTKEQVIAAAKSLSADDRAEIVAAIDPGDDGFVMTDALRAELDRRVALIDAGKAVLLTREQFDARVAELMAARR